MVKYPVGGPDWWAGQAYWWDAEFWNESAVDVFGDMSLKNAAHWSELFDPRTGRARRPGDTRYVVVYGRDVRFRLAGRQLVFERDSYLFEPERPWRADWIASGIYADGWSLPQGRVTFTVFAQPSQTSPLRRALTLAGSTTDDAGNREVTIRSNLERWTTTVAGGESFERQIMVCVPPGGTGRVVVESQGVSYTYRDPTKAALTGEIDRPTSFHLRTAGLADETERQGPCPR